MRRQGGIRLVPQRNLGDCGVACLAMLTRQPYEDVFLTVAQNADKRRRGRRGLTTRQMLRSAKALDFPLVERKPGKFDLETDEGILGVDWRDGTGHWAYLVDGWVFDTDGLVWAVEDYLTEEKGKADCLLVPR